MRPAVSLVIPQLNDSALAIETINSIYDTIDVDNFEVILVDDGSRDKVPDSFVKPNLRIVRHFINLGVGAAFDTGVTRVAQSENVILLGADIQFTTKNWCSRMLSVLDRHEKAIICTECQGSTHNKTYYGADIIFMLANEHVSKNHPRKGIPNYRAIFEGKWRGRTGRGVYPIPSLMGAFYGVKKSWYEHIRGFELHYIWGVLEPYISLKSWIMGGEVLVDTENTARHTWRRPSRSPAFDALAYNQLMVAGTVFGTYGGKYATYLLEGGYDTAERAAKIYTSKQYDIDELADYIKENRVLEPHDLERMMVSLSVEYNKRDKYPNPLSKK
jgi:glycosyltransferase involved in cell wall biosynthesis